MAEERVTRSSEKEITRMWRVYRTVMEMVADRVRHLFLSRARATSLRSMEISLLAG